MSRAPVALLLLPGSGDAEATLASVHAEAGADIPVATLAEAGEELLALADVIAFARAGDRWRPGSLTQRLRILVAHPTAAVSIAGHAIVDASGEEVATVAAPQLPLDPVAVLGSGFEPAAALVLSELLDAAALELLRQPRGDVALLSRLTRSHGLVRSSEIAAEVPLDPERHGFRRGASAAELLAAAAEAGDEPGASALRRELLRRLFLDVRAERAEGDLAELLGPAADGRAAAVVADLQWALERGAEALATERVPWPRAAMDDEDAPGLFVEEELFDLRGAVQHMCGEVELRDALIRRYEAEILRRDAIISRLTATPLGQVAVADREASAAAEANGGEPSA